MKAAIKLFLKRLPGLLVALLFSLGLLYLFLEAVGLGRIYRSIVGWWF